MIIENICNILSIYYLLFFSFIVVLPYLLNWLDLDNVALLESVVCAVFLGESSSIFDNAPPDPKDAENFLADLGDSSVLNIWPLLWIGELMGEFLALALLLLIALGDEVNRCCKDWLKSMVTFKKKSQTDKFFPNSLADLYLKLINHYTFILQSVKSMSIVTRKMNIVCTWLFKIWISKYQFDLIHMIQYDK